MGVLSFLASSFMEGWRSGQQPQQPQQPPAHSTQTIPHTPHLFYPAILPRFDEISADGHDDPRALVYSLSWLDPRRKRPFACGELNALDFGNGKDGEKKACQILLEKGLICSLTPDRVLAEIYTVQELKDLLRQRGLPVSGNKPVLVDAQRPDATACASMELWNETMRRWVKPRSKGIALIRKNASGRPHKRLESGSFQWPRDGGEVRALSWQQYRWLMEGLRVDQPKAHREVKGLSMV